MVVANDVTYCIALIITIIGSYFVYVDTVVVAVVVTLVVIAVIGVTVIVNAVVWKVRHKPKGKAQNYNCSLVLLAILVDFILCATFSYFDILQD